MYRTFIEVATPDGRRVIVLYDGASRRQAVSIYNGIKKAQASEQNPHLLAYGWEVKD
jgi:hypothetical protein